MKIIANIVKKNVKIEFWVLGKTNESFIQTGIQHYLNKLKHFTQVEIVVFSDVKVNSDTNLLKIKEAEKFLDKLKEDDFVVLLDESGELMNSRKFAQFIEQKQNHSLKKIIFVVGGAFGFAEKMYQRANFKLSISAMTFSHQSIRLIFLEQLYRAYTIIHHFPYHND